jgi:hypothetical protein
MAMTGGRHTEIVEARADLILCGEGSAEAYTVHFEAQMRRGTIRRLLCAAYACFARAGASLAGFDPGATG